MIISDQVTTVSLVAWNGADFEMQSQFNGLGDVGMLGQGGRWQ